jgi:hypothetical protein
VDASQVSAAANVVEATAVAVGVGFAWWQLRDAAAGRRDQNRAYVVAFLDEAPEMRSVSSLVVQNLGSTAAYDISLKADPPLRSSMDDGIPIVEVGMVKSGIPMLAPGQKIETLFDSAISRPDDWETTYAIHLTYRDRWGENHTDDFTLDNASRYNTTYFTEKGLGSISDNLGKIAKELNDLRRGSLDVVIEERTARRKRVAKERAAYQRLRELRTVRAPRPETQTNE